MFDDFITLRKFETEFTAVITNEVNVVFKTNCTTSPSFRCLIMGIVVSYRTGLIISSLPKRIIGGIERYSTPHMRNQFLRHLFQLMCCE